MRIVRVLLLITAFIVLVACNPTTTPTPVVPSPTPSPEATDTPTPNTDTFVPFQDFLQGVKDAKLEDYAGKDGVQVKDEADFEEMRQHIVSMYDGVVQVSSFIQGDQYFDCITIESQPAAHLPGSEKIILTPPDGAIPGESGTGSVPGDYQYVQSPLTLGLKDSFGNVIACEDGTIPMARMTLEVLTRYENLDQYLSKDRNGGGSLPILDDSHDPALNVHTHAFTQQRITNFGGNSWLNLWNPSLGDGIFSLSQQWYVGGTDDNTQTIEGGWQVDPVAYKSNNAALFIFYTADNYKSKDKKCYNLECKAFKLINNHWALGATWDHYSSDGGTQWGFEMQWKLYQGNWWLFLKGPGSYEAVGYYPTSIFGGGQMSKSAEWVKYGGEIDTENAFPQMGSGQFAEKDWQHAAFQKSIFYIPRDENGGVGVWATLIDHTESAKCYTVNLIPATQGSDWGTYFYYGGPGGPNC